MSLFSTVGSIGSEQGRKRPHVYVRVCGVDGFIVITLSARPERVSLQHDTRTPPDTHTHT